MSDKDFLSSLKPMEGGCNLATDSSEKHALANACYQQMDFEEVLAKGLVKTQQEAFAGEINLRSDELLSERLAGCVKSQHGPKDKLSVKYTNESQTLPQNYRNVYPCLDEQTIELLQSILTTTKPKKDVGTRTLGSEALTAVSLHASPDRNPDLKNFKVDFNPTKTFHLPRSRSVHTHVESAVFKITQKPSAQATAITTSMEKDSVRSDWSLSFKGKQLDFFDSLKEKLQQKDLENQQIVRLLLKKHQELRDVKEMLKLKEVEAQLTAEKLKCEGQENFEVNKRFNNVWENMNKKLSIAKNHNESFAKQLQALLEKYERLKKRANIIKEQLLQEHTKKKSSQKTVKKIQKMAEELLMNQTLLEKQKDAATRELSACKKKMEKMEKEQKQHIRIVQRVEEEKSVITAEYEDLKDELHKTQEENKKLTEVQSKEVGKRRAEENLLESQNVVKQLYAELDESKSQRESIFQQLDAMKKEIKRIHNRHKVERLQLQEQKQTCMKQCEDLRTECDALNEVVSKLKKDKHTLKEELECHQKEKAKAETASKREGERLREALSLLERERELLLDEMGDLRKDYFSLSDRITQRLGQLDQADAPMCITDISSFHHCRAPKVDNTMVPVTPSMDMIEHIRRKLEEEETVQQK